MNNETLSQYNDVARKTAEAFQQFNAINVETLQKLTALQMDFTRVSVESATAQAHVFSTSQDPQTIATAESELLSTYGEKLMALGNETNEILSESGEQLVSLAKASFETNNTAPAAAKKPAKKNTAKKSVKK